jgi:hypothetical protein
MQKHMHKQVIWDVHSRAFRTIVIFAIVLAAAMMAIFSSQYVASYNQNSTFLKMFFPNKKVEQTKNLKPSAQSNLDKLKKGIQKNTISPPGYKPTQISPPGYKPAEISPPGY